MDALEAILTRRSYERLQHPGPSASDLNAMLLAAAAAPDHGQLRPFRFTILDGVGKEAFGAVLAAAYLRRCIESGAEPVPARAEKERSKLGRAPLVIVVSAVRQGSSRIPWVEQRDAAAAATENLLLAAHGLGYGAMWRTGDACGDSHVKLALGRDPEDAIIGFVYVGTPMDTKPSRDTDLSQLVRHYGA